MTPDAGAIRRLRRYLELNFVAMATSALALALLYPYLGHNPSIAVNVAVLLAACAVIALGWWATRRERTALGAAGLALGSWVAAFGITYSSPFAAPLGLLAFLAPVVSLLEHLPRRALHLSLGLTVVAAGAVCAVAESRRAYPDSVQPEPWLAALMLLAFLPIVVAVVTAGIAQQIGRLTSQADELASSRRRLAIAADEARSAIERDLHDGAQQHLVTISVELGRVARMIERAPADGLADLQRVRTELQEAIRELRDLAHGIYPALLTERGLTAALPAAGRRTSTPCTVQVAGVDRLPRRVEAAVYFCCVEAMHNADKHADADLIAVRVDGRVDEVTFTVIDDGRGFDPASARGGLGLTGMGDRVRAAGGEFTLTSAPGCGTTVAGRIPYADSPA